MNKLFEESDGEDLFEVHYDKESDELGVLHLGLCDGDGGLVFKEIRENWGYRGVCPQEAISLYKREYL